MSHKPPCHIAYRLSPQHTDSPHKHKPSPQDTGPSHSTHTLPTSRKLASGHTASPQDKQTCPTAKRHGPKNTHLPHNLKTHPMAQTKSTAQRLSPQHSDKFTPQHRDAAVHLTARICPHDAQLCAMTHKLFLQCTNSLQSKHGYHAMQILAPRCAHLPYNMRASSKQTELHNAHRGLPSTKHTRSSSDTLCNR